MPLLRDIDQAITDYVGYPLIGGMAYAFDAMDRLAFRKVESVHASPATAIGLQRAWVATRKPGLSELASIAREREVPGWGERTRQSPATGIGVS